MPTAIFCPVTSVDKTKFDLGFKVRYREVVEVGGTYTLREPSEAYGGDFGIENDALMPHNTIAWRKNTESTEK